MNFKEHLLQNDVFVLLAECTSVLGQPSYLVGGYVRDLVLGRACKDIDVVVVGSGIELAQIFHNRIQSTYPLTVFKNYGTAMVRYLDMEVEFVGARRESYRRDSRKPIVENGSLEDDQKRRDFTINALAISLNAADFGALLDPFRGIQDIEAKVLRTPLEPGITFSDDPLRMMRACRFASQLGFDIEPTTFEAIQREAERISIVSMERTVAELNKIILSPTPSYGFKLLYFGGVLKYIFPELVALQGVETQEGKGHKDNFFHTLQVLDNIATRTDDVWLRWAAILHDIAKPSTKRYEKGHGWTFHGHEERGAKMVPGIFKRMRLPMGDAMRKVQKLVRLHHRPISLSKEEVTDSAMRRLIFDAGEHLEDLMKLCTSDITSKNPDKVKRYIQNFELVKEKIAQVEEADKIRNFQPVIDGVKIMEVFGLKPGKEVGLLKEEIKEAVLEGRVPNEYQPALEYLIRYAKDMGLVPTHHSHL